MRELRLRWKIRRCRLVIARSGSENVRNWRGVRAIVASRGYDTIRDTLSWDLARGGPAPGKEGLAAAEEERLLRQLAV